MNKYSTKNKNISDDLLKELSESLKKLTVGEVLKYLYKTTMLLKLQRKILKSQTA